MTDGRERRLYQPPIAQDLSGFTAVGQQPMGSCASGPRPYYTCIAGTGFVGACSDGSLPDTSECGGGSIHSEAACNKGYDALTGCKSGSGQNF